MANHEILTDRYVLVSVSDKTNIGELTRVLGSLDYRIISTGGTAKSLEAQGIKVIPIQDITGNPEAFGGRMKTISFQIEGGILFDRDNPEHARQAQRLGMPNIEIVVCNLYPFEQTIARPGVTMGEAVENIDVGGPTMIRAAAKNFEQVLVVTDPADYQMVAKMLTSGALAVEDRRQLAAKAFRHLAFYDSLIGAYFDQETFPAEMTIPGRLNKRLRYGENPHQAGALYIAPNVDSPLGRLRRVWGRELSATNVTDIDAGLQVVKLFPETAAACVIKHNTPCGIALGESAAEALSRAIEADPVSAFGGVIVMNWPLEMAAAETIGLFKDERNGNIDIVAAPSIDDDAALFLTSVRKSMGLYTFGSVPRENRRVVVRHVDGGFVLQTVDKVEEGLGNWKVVTEAQPTVEQMAQMRLGWRCISRIRSNSVIVVDRQLPMTRGIGTGQTSRVMATEIALKQAGEHAREAILVSDSFFPFSDSVALAVQYGIAAIVQQGGSVRDGLSVDLSNEARIPMVFTGRRAFWH